MRLRVASDSAVRSSKMAAWVTGCIYPYIRMDGYIGLPGAVKSQPHPCW